MKKQSTKSGKTPAVISQPKQTTSAPTPEQVLSALDDSIAVEVEQFNSNLALARGMWRANRKLVEAKNWPEPWRTIYMQTHDGEEPTNDSFHGVRSVERIRQALLPQARQIAAARASRASKDKLSPAAANLIDEHGALADPPTTTYLLLAQHFEEGREIDILQEVELTYDENWKLRRYLAELRGLIQAKDAAA